MNNVNVRMLEHILVSLSAGLLRFIERVSNFVVYINAYVSKHCIHFVLFFSKSFLLLSVCTFAFILRLY